MRVFFDQASLFWIFSISPNQWSLNFVDFKTFYWIENCCVLRKIRNYYCDILLWFILHRKVYDNALSLQDIFAFFKTCFDVPKSFSIFHSFYFIYCSIVGKLYNWGCENYCLKLLEYARTIVTKDKSIQYPYSCLLLFLY